jgi:hypothetical protein
MEIHHVQCDGPGCPVRIELLGVKESEREKLLFGWITITRFPKVYYFHVVECLLRWREEHGQTDGEVQETLQS